MKKILIWSERFNNGFIQKPSEDFVFNQVLTEKPNLSFSYIQFKYEEISNTYICDDRELNEDEKNEIISFIDSFEIPEVWTKNVKMNNLKNYLLSTDYINFKYLEEVNLYKTITEEAFFNLYKDVYDKRKEVRSEINLLESES